MMDARKLIEMALAYKGMSNSELARALGWSPQSLNQRLNTGKFTMEEWGAIAAAMGAKVRVAFSFADGKVIE